MSLDLFMSFHGGGLGDHIRVHCGILRNFLLPSMSLSQSHSQLFLSLYLDWLDFLLLIKIVLYLLIGNYKTIKLVWQRSISVGQAAHLSIKGSNLSLQSSLPIHVLFWTNSQSVKLLPHGNILLLELTELHLTLMQSDSVLLNKCRLLLYSLQHERLSLFMAIINSFHIIKFLVKLHKSISSNV